MGGLSDIFREGEVCPARMTGQNEYRAVGFLIKVRGREDRALIFPVAKIGLHTPTCRTPPSQLTTPASAQHALPLFARPRWCEAPGYRLG